MPITVACQCGAKFAAKDELAGKAVKCPKCSQPLKIPGGATPAAPAATPKPQAARPSAPAVPPVQSAGVGSILDEIGVAMAHVGMKCPKCNAPIQPESVICLECGLNLKTGKQMRTESDTAAMARRDAIYAKQAAKAEGRPQQQSKSGSYTDKPGADLGGADIFLCVLCSGIGLIVGIVYCVTGNPKGPKMLGISLVFVVIWNIVRFVLVAQKAGVPVFPGQ